MSDTSRTAAGLLVCLAASVIEFSTTADRCTYFDSCNEKKTAWALACGVVSTFLCLIGLSLTKLMPGRPAVVDLVLAVLLLGIWIFGASFNTATTGIYAAPGNGYFSTWIALLGAAYYAHLSLGHIRERLERHVRANGPVLVLVASIVEMATAADYYSNGGGDSADNQHSARAAWAVAVGVVSSFFCLAQLVLSYLHSPIAEASGKFLGVFLVALWAAGAGVNTSVKGPFSAPGNGYFFSWFAFGASIFYAFSNFGGSAGAYEDDTRPYAPAPTGSTGSGPAVVDVPPAGTGPGYQTLE